MASFCRFTRRTFSVCLRFFVYYLIYLTIWRCPPGSMLDEGSPGLCRPLHGGFDSIQRYVGPYYTYYVEPTVHKMEPVTSRGTAAYRSYVHPVVVSSGQKALEWSGPLAGKAQDIYDEHASHHVQKLVAKRQQYVDPQCEKVVKLRDSVCPYVSHAGSVIYERAGVPAAELSGRYLDKSRQVVMTRVAPFINQHSQKFASFSRVYANNVINWFVNVVYPKVHEVYTDRIEPQFFKIHHRIKTRRDADDDSELFINTNEFKAALSSKMSSATAAVASAVDTSVDTQTAETLTESPAVTAEAEAADNETQQYSGADAAKGNLEHWKTLIHKTTKEAFGSFLDDVEAEKNKMMDEVRPGFTEVLQALQKVQTDTIKNMTKLVNGIESGEDITVAAMQDKFRYGAEEVRKAALAVRTKSEKVASEAIDRTEALRQATVEVLDEFSEVALQEIGRNLVSVSSGTSTTSNTNTNWKDWKEYRSLKDHLLNTRQEIVDYDINMSVVNKMLREAQETSNVLARETAEYLAGLRAKADFLFQGRIQKQKQDEDMDEEVSEDEPYPIDVEIYEELEDEEPAEETLTVTHYKTHTTTAATHQSTTSEVDDDVDYDDLDMVPDDLQSEDAQAEDEEEDASNDNNDPDDDDDDNLANDTTAKSKEEL